MRNDKIFHMLINDAIKICERCSHDESLEDYHERYLKLLDSLNKVGIAVQEGKLYTDVSDLGVIKMIVRNDPSDLCNAVLNMNKHFRDNYSLKLKRQWNISNI